MDITIQTLAEMLREYDAYRLVYHIRPDGDCIGSTYALGLALQAIGKKCEVVGQDEIPNVHRSLTDAVTWDAVENPVYIAVDTASLQRVGSYGVQHYTFCIDHHANTFTEAEYRCVEKDCGACCEIIYKLIVEMGIPVTKQMADFLYTGLVTDTNCFRTSDTSVQSFATAAALAKLGADTYEIGRRNMFIKSKGRLKVEAKLRSTFHYTCDDQILTGVIMLQDLEEAGVKDSDLEGINSLVEQVEGVRIGVTIRELHDGTMRCSVRTSGTISANEICKTHGGGGHFHAGCCELAVDVATARTIMEQTCRDFL